MQIIQNIREKGAAIIIVVIALSLIGFLLMDAKQGSNNLFKGASNNIGSINGSSISNEEFTKKVKQAEAMREQQSQQKLSPTESAQIRGQVWDQLVAEKVFFAEADKLGITFTSKELSTILSSDDPSNPLVQDKNMIDPATGKLDPSKVKEALSTIKKAKGEQRDNIEAQVIEPQKIGSVSQKYMALLNGAAYYSSWREAKEKTESEKFATISYVAVPYTTISDSAIKVTDAEVEKYVAANKASFKQEAGRKISYITFSQLPNSTDSADTRVAVEKLKNDFAADNNAKNFIARNSSMIPFDSNYVPKSRMQTSKLDSILKVPQGSVYGPYVDNGMYVLAKILGSKTIADSAKARHILIATADPQSGQQLKDDSSAKKQADSILAAIKAGAPFAGMAAQFSTDPGSKDKGGFYDYFAYGQMVPEFNDFCFNKPSGTMAVVKTQFGYHIIEALGTKGSSQAYKAAFMAKEIVASEATINNANIEASKLSAEKTAAKLDAYVKAKGLNKVSLPFVIKENDYTIGQLQNARELVKWAYGAKQGDVSEPYIIGEQFVVASLDKIYAEGTQDVATARPMAENAIKNEKKGAEISKKLGTNPTLESAAAAYSQQVKTAGADSSLTFGGQLINGIGYEPKLMGAAFNTANQNKVSAPIVGKTGVYVFKVDGYGQKTEPNAEAAEAIRKGKLDALRSQSVGNWYEGLKKLAKIDDKRSTIY